MAEGYVMTIPKSVLDKLTQADAKITQIAQNSERTRDRVRISFEAMANSVNPFIEKLNALKSLSSLKIDGTLKSSATAAEKTANSVAQVAIQLNRVAESPIDNVNRKIQSLRDLLDQSVSASQKMQTQMAAINQGGGVISKNTLTEGGAGASLATQIQAELKALELERNLLQQNSKYWKQYIDNLNGSSIASQRQKAEMDKLNSTFRNGASLTQRQAKAETEFGNAVVKAVIAMDKAAKAQERKNEASKKTSNKEAARAEEQYHRALKRTEGTIIQRTTKIEALARAQKALTATGRDYTTYLSRITSETQRLQKANSDAANSMTKLKSSQSKVMDITGQLTRQFALLFSVSAIKGYMDKLVAVRGEFELQQTALRSILQDKEKADEVWSKTVQLAVKSPFTVKELVTYTKQLAAYRIESDKLYETNKMLADVSAGLGVSMDRLILAFGQVKAANYLRASEVRQFTEAGVNILGELSTIYTELEGRMVSVADVQERITKRMVKFGDVEEVFKRITSAGGIFYNMQEVQAETLAGMMSNLQDTFDLMFNEIGKANEGVLKGFVTLLKDIVNNWQTIANVAVPIITTMTARWLIFKAALAGTSIKAFFLPLYDSLRLVSMQLTQTTSRALALQRVMKKTSGATLFGGWLSILAAVGTTIWWIVNAIKEAKKQQEELNKIASEGQSNAITMATNYKRLANVVSDSTKSVEEQDEALKELRRTYGEILPAHLLEAKTIRELQGNYEGATNAIYNYIDAKTKEAQVRKVLEDYGEKINDEISDMASQLVVLAKAYSNANIPQLQFIKILNQMKEEMQNGELAASDFNERLRELVFTSTGVELPELNVTKVEKGMSASMTKLKNNIARDAKQISGLFLKLKNTVDSIFSSDLGIGNYMEKRFEEVKKGYDDMFDNVQSSWNVLSKSKEPNSLVTEEQINTATKRLTDYYDWLEVKAPDFSDIINSPFQVKEEIFKANKNIYGKYLDELKGMNVEKKEKPTLLKYIESVEKEINNFDGTKFQKQIRNIIKEWIDINKVDSIGFEKVLANNLDNVVSYAKALKALRPSIVEEIHLLSNASSLMREGISEEDAKKKIKILENLNGYIDYFLKNNTYDQKTEKKGESEADKRLKKQLSLLKEIGKAYEDNLKYYSKEEAAAKTRLDYAAAAREAGIGDLVTTMTFDPSGIISGIEEIGKQASEKMKLDVERSIADIKGKAEIEVRAENIEQPKKQLEELFAGYEITVEMGKMGLQKDVIAKLFNIDSTSLDDIKTKINSIYPDVKSLSEEQLKIYNHFQKEITKYEQKELNERLKMFTEYLSQSVDKVKQVQNSGALKISIATDFFEKGKLDAEQYATVIKNVSEEVNREISKINTAKFKETPEYIQAMGDLAAYSKSQLESLLAKLREFISKSAGNISASDLKVYSDAIDKIQTQLDNIKSPFSKNAFAEAKQLMKLQKEYNAELKNQERIVQEIELAEKELQDAKERALNLQNNPDAVMDANYSDEIAAAAEEINVANENLSNTNTNLKVSQDKLSGISGKIGKISGGMSAAMGAVDKIVTGIYQSINATLDVINQFKDLAESKGVDTDKGAWREIKQAGEVLGNVNERVMSSWNNFKSGNIAGAIADAIGSITTVFTTLNKQHDKRREKKIEKEIELVNKLSREYSHLERAIDNAYTIDTLNLSTKNAEENLKQQIQSYENMISAEQSKKNKDQTRIDEWTDEIQKKYEELEDLQFSKLQELGGFGSGAEMKSAADEFASAWLSAYKETGDGLDALTDKWDEYIDNIIMKQMSLRGIEKFLKPVMDMIDKALEGDSYFDTEEEEKIDKAIEDSKGKLNNFWKQIAEMMGIPIGENNNTELSGLSSSIQGISEDQAGVIEGYLNSIRFFVADSNMQLQTIALFFSADPAQNPMYSEMMAQTRLLRSIDDRLASVITSAGNHPLSGFAIKSII